MTEMTIPIRDLTYNADIPMPETSMIGFYPFDQMRLLEQEQIDQMATEAATLFVATMKVLQHFSSPTIIHRLGSASIHNFVKNDHETQFTITDQSTAESLVMIYHREGRELGQRFYINEVVPKPYRPNFTVKMNKVIGEGKLQLMRSAT